MQKNKVEMTLEVNGRSMREFAHEGKSYVESREGTEYSIRLTNNTGGRVLAVLSVDGINAISGKPTSDNPSEAGYVLGAGESHVIKGYRVDENTAANFKFVKREGSYATEKAEGQGNGVIAVRVWEEKAKKEGITLTACCANNMTPISAQANPFAHGSTFGEAVQDRVKEVEFKAGMFLVELCIYYAPLEGLKVLGVDVTKTKAVSFPEPFKRGFCAPPSGWKKSD